METEMACEHDSHSIHRDFMDARLFNLGIAGFCTIEPFSPEIARFIIIRYWVEEGFEKSQKCESTNLDKLDHSVIGAGAHFRFARYGYSGPSINVSLSPFQYLPDKPTAQALLNPLGLHM